MSAEVLKFLIILLSFILITASVVGHFEDKLFPCNDTVGSDCASVVSPIIVISYFLLIIFIIAYLISTRLIKN
ncbi:MAG: hypothetical protein ACXAD7_19950 [Candidatus Kariarchaeaceae archaeon]